jgi:lipopolysaccharide export system permease protein
MLFHSAFRTELSRYFWATLVVLVSIVMTVLLIRTLGQASRGNIDPAEVSLVLGYTVLGNMHTIVTLSLYIASVAALSRMYVDSEMVIWQSSGKSSAGLLRPALVFAAPVLVVVAGLALVVWPWTNAQTHEMRERYEKRGDLERVKPGQFQESSSGNRVFFIDKDSLSDVEGTHVFIAAQEKGLQTITSAQAGKVEIKGEDRYLVLKQGQRIEINPLKNEIKVIEFKQHGAKLGDSPLELSELEAQSAMPWVLIKKPVPVNLGELTWRIGLAIGAFNLVLLGVAIPYVNPRSGRTGSLVMAMLTFFIYYNFINVSRNAVASGQWGMPSMLFILHAPVTALGLIGLWWRSEQLNLLQFIRQILTFKRGAA